VQPLRGSDSIMWTIKFRNGTLKRFKFPIRTTPEGSINPFGSKPESKMENITKSGFFNQESRPRLFGQQIGLDKWSLAVIMPRVFPAAGCCSKSHPACGRQATDAVAEYCRN
jgi:hypothetical protein